VAETSSRSFDRAAPYYDATRGLGAAATASVTDLLVSELDGRGACLEVGVGTGRVALPLHEAGIPMTGVDLSRPMMTVLVEKAGGIAFPLVEGDATALPFPAARFGAGVVSHVFHLIPAWRRALVELARVVRPGGLVLSDLGSHDRSTLRRAVRDRFRHELGSDAGGHPGARHDGEELAAALRGLGARQRSLPVVRATRTTTLESMINSLEAGHWSWTWDVPAAVLRAAAERTRAWAATEHGALDSSVVAEVEVRWLAFDLP
jgi:ubiquinone/menaquinone biosynthesis C-methylase UbiE